MPSFTTKLTALTLATVVACTLGGIAADAASSKGAPVLPRGCGLQYGGQAFSAFEGRIQSYPWEDYNVVPPGHKVRGARISWGDGKTSIPKITMRPQGTKGCTTTLFTARHTYKHIKCVTKAKPCTHTYKVVIRYHDPATKHKYVMALLKVIVLRTEKKK